jgi:broad specificity phosphatase PhoE
VSRVVLLRHAEPEEDSRGRCYGSLDVGLSATGLEHAQRLARDLVGLSLDAVYSSPRRRALDTAAPIAAVHGLAPEVDDRLRELDFGILEGRRYEEIERSEPELFRAWMEMPAEVSFPGGESYADLRRRAVAACDEIRLRHGCALAVTHGGVVRAVVSESLGIPAAAIFRLDQSYGGVTVVDWIEETPIVRLLNGTTLDR